VRKKEEKGQPDLRPVGPFSFLGSLFFPGDMIRPISSDPFRTALILDIAADVRIFAALDQYEASCIRRDYVIGKSLCYSLPLRGEKT